LRLKRGVTTLRLPASNNGGNCPNHLIDLSARRPSLHRVGPAFLRCGGASPPASTRSRKTHVAHHRIKIERVHRPYLTASEAAADRPRTHCADTNFGSSVTAIECLADFVHVPHSCPNQHVPSRSPRSITVKLERNLIFTEACLKAKMRRCDEVRERLAAVEKEFAEVEVRVCAGAFACVVYS
jgi:hypothetical protein